jgi:hypothetical protein
MNAKNQNGCVGQKSKNRFSVIPAEAEILMVQFILHWPSLLKPEIEFKIIKPGDRWVDPL